ncbi:hypothetical protein [Paenibacillus dendrobii]|nr:hypothetical protein [Paenibacillus dendrobii]
MAQLILEHPSAMSLYQVHQRIAWRTKEMGSPSAARFHYIIND